MAERIIKITPEPIYIKTNAETEDLAFQQATNIFYHEYAHGLFEMDDIALVPQEEEAYV